MATLEIYDQHGRRGQPVTLSGDRFSIGRLEDNDLVINDENVSRHHAVLECYQQRWLMRDLNSRNGVAVEGVRILDEAMLKHNDEIVLGTTRLVYLNPSETRGKTTAPLKQKPPLTAKQKEVLIELCRPVLNGGRFIAPAPDGEIAERMYVGEGAVRNHLSDLYRKFEIDPGRQRRARLADEAINRGSVTMKDLLERPEDDQPGG